MPMFLFMAALAVLFFYGVMLYNSLVRLKHEVTRCWANIDILLKQRHDELPKLVDVCRHYSQFEQDTLTRVMEARAMLSEAARSTNVGRIGELEGQLRSLTGQIFAVAEAYPELQADAQFSHLAQRITQLEDGIADRRELYNEAVNLNNVRIEQFPDVIVASLFSFRPAKPLRFADSDKRDVDIGALFQR